MHALLLLAACAGSKPGAPRDSGAPPDTADSGDALVLDPACPDGAYTETLPDASEDISDLLADYGSLDRAAFARAVLERRYPNGAWILEAASEALGQDCGALFAAYTSERLWETTEYALVATGVLVHECGHMLDLQAADEHRYYFNQDLMFQPTGGSAPDAPARSRVLEDEWTHLRPPCPETGAYGCDGYADTYLPGDPDDAEYDAGDEGLDSVADELLQYVHGLAVGLSVREEMALAGLEDGLLTFLWYLERYLAYWRATDPAAYEAAMVDGGWAELLLNLWGRAWLHLDASAPYDDLGVDRELLEPLVLEPALLAEMEHLRELVGCR